MSASRRFSKQHGGDTVRTLKATVTEGQEVRRLDDSNSGELGDQHIEYTIKVRKTAEWTVKRRFRDFEDFRHRLKLYIANKYKDRPLKVPSLPKKRGMFQKMVMTTCKEDFVVDRGRGLNAFLEALMSQREFVACPEFGEFLTKPTAGHVASRGPEVFKIMTDNAHPVDALGKNSSISKRLSETSVGSRHSKSSSTSSESLAESATEATSSAETQKAGAKQNRHTISLDSSASEDLLLAISDNESSSANASNKVDDRRSEEKETSSQTTTSTSKSLTSHPTTPASKRADAQQFSRSAPIELQPSRLRTLDDLLQKLSVRQRVTFKYEDPEDLSESLSNGLILAHFPDCSTEIAVEISETSDFRDRVEFRGVTIVNGHRSSVSGYASKMTLKGEAGLYPIC